MGDFARTISIAVPQRRGRDWRLSIIPAAEQTREEVAAAAVIGAAVAAALIIAAASARIITASAEPRRLIGNGHDFAVRSVDPVLDRDVRDLALAPLEDSQ